MNFKDLCNSINNIACVMSVKRINDINEIRIVDGNEKYLDSFKGDYYKKNEFIPNSIYTKYIKRNLNFEEYCYRSAVKKELLHSYGYPEYFKAWLHMLFIPIDYEDNDTYYCLYIMEINNVFNPENLANSGNDINEKVLRATLELANTGDFNLSLKRLTAEIRKICNASFCCILLVDDIKDEINVLAEDRDLNSDRLLMKDYMDSFFYDIVKSWDRTIADSNCIIINNEADMNYIKERNINWYNSIIDRNIKSLVLFRLKSGNDQIGYMWVSNFNEDSTKIKEILEVTTFILGFEIGNHLLVNKLTELSSIDLLTGLYNRNKMNNYMEEINDRNDSIGVIFLDINGLKRTNDTEGHLAGDKLIKRAANILKNVFNDSYIFRAGGDEFVVFIDNISDFEMKNYIDKLDILSKKNNVSFAIGYSIKKDNKNIDVILKEADFNMYNDKRNYYMKKEQL